MEKNFSGGPEQPRPSISVTPQDIDAGQNVYTKTFLKFYDVVVLRIFNRLIWQCPSRNIQQMYQRHVSNNHLEVGVGTGIYLQHCRFPSENPRLGILDLNPHCLDVAARRLARYRPEIYRKNLYEPMILNAPAFDSIGLNYVLHCLPGNFETKSVVLAHLKKLLNPGGVIFGATLLGKDVDHPWQAKIAMRIFNDQKIFSNRQDSLAELKTILAGEFKKFDATLIGSAALFWGRV